MEFLKLLLSSGLLFLGAVALTINENSKSNHCLIDEGHLPYNIIPLHYDINVTFDTDLIVTEGKCNIKIHIKHPTRNISFHADSSQILSSKLQSTLKKSIISFKRKDTGVSDSLYIEGIMRDYETKMLLYCEKYHIVTLLYDEELPSGFYVLYLTLRNVGGRSFFRTSYINEIGDRTWLVATDFQAIGARKLFPCWDDPVFRATFNISIQHHSNYMVLSNMPKQKIRQTSKPNIIQTIFEQTPQIPTYQVSVLLIMHFRSIFMGEAHVQYRDQLHVHYIKFAVSIIGKVIEYLKSQEKCFEEFPQVTHVAIPGFLYDAVTNPLGLIYYRETAIIYDEKDSTVHRTEIARLIGRTVAYQCFYKIIPIWWSNMWLNEGIAMLLGMDAVDEVYPTFRMKDYFVVQIQQESLRFDTDSIMKPLISEVNDLPDIDSVFSISYYIKAPVIMRMIQQILTNKVFRKGINMYLNKEAPSFLSRPIQDVFWFAMQTAYNEIRADNEELNIKQMMDAWTKQQHYPLVKVIQSKSSVMAFVKSMNTREYNWWLPYTIATQMDPDFFLSNRSQQLIMQNSFTEKVFSCDIAYGKWIIVNVQQIGYYRVNYDVKGWLNIARYLNSDEFDKIHVLNRAQIIDDAFYFLMKGQLKLFIFLELARYLSQERDYIAWYPMIKAFEYMSSFFPFPGSTYLKNVMIRILDILLEEIRYKKTSERSINSLREEAAKWACTFGSLECKRKALAKLTTDLITEENSWMKEWTLCNGLMIQNSTSWYNVLNIYLEKFHYTILKFMACSEHFFIIRNNIESIGSIVLSEKTKDIDRIHIFHSIVARHAKNDTTLDYILTNFDRLKPRNISATVALLDIINHVYSKEQLNKITKFLQNYQRIRTTDFPKHPLIDDKYVKIKEDTMNNIQKLVLGKISLFKRKIKMRLFQIVIQIDHFHILETKYLKTSKKEIDKT